MEQTSFPRYQHLKKTDPAIYDLIEKEEYRQWAGLELIASENYTSDSVLDCLGSCLTNKYSEGTVDARYYGGNEFIDQIESLCIERALNAFNLKSSEWGVNVQPYSGSPANMEAYLALINPGDRLMGLDLPSGGHLTHGYKTPTKKISASSLIFESAHYQVNPETGIIDYEDLAKKVAEFKPKILICGASAYPRDFDYKKFREIADSVGAYLLADIAHISGLVSSGLMKSPFEYCDIVTSTSHKTMRAARGGLIFYKKDTEGKMKERINFSVFPSLQGGPHNNNIAGIATQLLELGSQPFIDYSKQVVANAKHLGNVLVEKGFKLATGGTDNHLLLVDVRPMELTGNKVEKACDLVHITLNKNAVYGDKSALAPGGIRIGTPALTTRKMVEKDMESVADFLDRIVKICIEVQNVSGKKMKDFLPLLEKNEKIIALRDEVQAFAKKFYIPGIDVSKFEK